MRALRGVDALDDNVGLVEPAFRVTAPPHVADECVRGLGQGGGQAVVGLYVRMEQRRAGGEGFLRLQHGRQFLVYDVDQINGPLGGFGVGGGDGCDALAREPDALVGEHRNVAHPPSVEDACDLVPGQHGVNAGEPFGL